MIRTRRPPSDFRQYFTVSEPVRCCICRPNVRLPSFRDRQSVGHGSNTYH